MAASPALVVPTTPTNSPWRRGVVNPDVHCRLTLRRILVMSKTIAVDFDGVLHAYSKGWQDGTIYDGPIPGAREAMQDFLAAGFEIVIYSTRCHDRVVNGIPQDNQVADITLWLDRHDIPFTRIWTEPGKPLAALFIDDNALRFTGDWLDTRAVARRLLAEKK